MIKVFVFIRNLHDGTFTLYVSKEDIDNNEDLIEIHLSNGKVIGEYGIIDQLETINNKEIYIAEDFYNKLFQEGLVITNFIYD